MLARTLPVLAMLIVGFGCSPEESDQAEADAANESKAAAAETAAPGAEPAAAETKPAPTPSQSEGKTVAPAAGGAPAGGGSPKAVAETAAKGELKNPYTDYAAVAKRAIRNSWPPAATAATAAAAAVAWVRR